MLRAKLVDLVVYFVEDPDLVVVDAIIADFSNSIKRFDVSLRHGNNTV